MPVLGARALAAGVPVLAADRGGLPELVGRRRDPAGGGTGRVVGRAQRAVAKPGRAGRARRRGARSRPRAIRRGSLLRPAACSYTAGFPHKLAPMMRRLVTSLAIVCALLAFAPVAVGAGSNNGPQAAIADCNDHQALTQHYSAATLRTALAIMPAAVRRVQQLLRRDREGAAGRGRGRIELGIGDHGLGLGRVGAPDVADHRDRDPRACRVDVRRARRFGAGGSRARASGPGGPDPEREQTGRPRHSRCAPSPRGPLRPRRPVRVRPRGRGLTTHGSNSVYRTVIFCVRLVTVPPLSSGSPVGQVHAASPSRCSGRRGGHRSSRASS